MNKHSFATRLSHLLLALVVIFQLLTSLIMEMPRDSRPGDVFFELHEYSGLAALFFSLGFWLVITLRRRGTAPGQLWPWFSASRRLDLREDVQRHWRVLKKLRIPAYDPDAALPSAVHGLGLLLISAMAVSGTLYFVALSIGATGHWLINLDLEVHRLLASLVWVYLIAHSGLALIHHFLGQQSLIEMWALGQFDKKEKD